MYICNVKIQGVSKQIVLAIEGLNIFSDMNCLLLKALPQHITILICMYIVQLYM